MHGCPNDDLAISHSLMQTSPEEGRVYSAHVATCVSCRLKLDEVRETLEVLPLALVPVPVPSGLRARVVGAVRQEARHASRSREVRRRWVYGLSGLAAALALLVGSYALLQVSGLRERLAGFQQAVPVERAVTLVGTGEAPGAGGRVLVAREGGGTRVSLLAQGLPALRPGEAYQLWLIKDGVRTSGGVFVVDGVGKGGVVSWLPEPVEFDAVGVTREPDAQGLKPRGPRVLGPGA